MNFIAWDGKTLAADKQSVEKRCSVCSENKDISEFTFLPSQGRHKAFCKTCSSRKAAEWRKNNLDRSSATGKAWRKRNLEKSRSASRQWNKEHRERIQTLCSARREAINAAQRARRLEKADPKYPETKKRYRLKHLDELRQYGYEWKRRNHAVVIAQATERKGHVKRATPKWADRDAIRRIYAECEALSKVAGIPHHVDHFIPLRSPVVCGLHVSSNLRVVPAQVNLEKGNRWEP